MRRLGYDGPARLIGAAIRRAGDIDRGSNTIDGKRVTGTRSRPRSIARNTQQRIVYTRRRRLQRLFSERSL